MLFGMFSIQFLPVRHQLDMRWATTGTDRLALKAPLLAVQVWKQKVFPFLKSHIIETVDSAASYLLLYHEATLANLLEVTLFHQDACRALGDDYLLELCDWCYRKLLYLNDEGRGFASKGRLLHSVSESSGGYLGGCICQYQPYQGSTRRVMVFRRDLYSRPWWFKAGVHAMTMYFLLRKKRLCAAVVC
jgi:hypothetical protein